MTPEFKQAIIAAIIRDQSRLKTFLVALALALAGMFTTRVMGVDLPTELNIAITAAVTMAVGWIIEGIGANANAAGGEAVQQAMQKLDSRVEVDRVIGPVTIAAVENAVQEIKDSERNDYQPRR